ncbi:MAG: M48 family metallopeptidase, partial [Actinobacteria bacterium]|nr:M48 family metallopeptidase [Actinomycetota bacterium]
RQELRIRAAQYLEHWGPIVGEPIEAWSVRRMKTKWGSCNPESKRLTFNTELAKKHPGCLEYIVVHELVHLIERRHNERFRELMDKHLPQWRTQRDELMSTPGEN